ncbi:PQQ-like beta-propeller repeat protein [Aeoliella sp. ICT_H6.2]|uniref:PQQ-like beta-propeller repeat protein n=1 Tax=Aeoliella straminimaris TaxID=2954799 RepID=A0A9X2JHS5_9BACT|nr:PQQ-like beta-propeller repeat protein [Aeoliella straminimaris]
MNSPIHAGLLEPAWSIDAPDYSARAGDRGVAIVDGDVYATMLDGYGFSGPYLVGRYDGDTGSQVWQIPIPANSHDGVSAPSVQGDTVFIHHWGHSGSSGSDFPIDYPALVGLDTQTGEQQFWTTHSGQWSSGSRPTIEGDAVFAAGGYYGGLDAYGVDGESRWFHKVNQQYGWIPAADSENVYVYMGEASASPGPSTGSLYVVDRDTGSRSATILHPSSSGTFYGQLQSVVLGGHEDALALTYNNHPAYPGSRTLVSFDLSEQTIAWEIGGEFSGNPAVGNGLVFVPEADVLRVVDQFNGETSWTWAGSNLSGNVVLTDRYAFVNSGNSVHAIDLIDRSSVWNSDGITGAIALDENLLIISNPNGVFAFTAVPEPMTGIYAWSAIACILVRYRFRLTTG